MALASTRQDFKNRVMRELGFPVIKINISEEQLDDRVDDALQVFYRRHYDGNERTYLAYQLTQSDADSKSIVLDPEIIGVAQVWPVSMSSGNNGLLFNVPYQLVMSEIFGTNGGGVSTDGVGSYVVMRHQMNVLQEFLVGRFPIRYNEKTNVLFIDVNSSKLVAGQYIIIECFKQNTAESYPDVWNDSWLRRYTVELVRRQWGQNLSKFGNLQLPGGVIMNGPQMVAQADSALKDLEEELETTWSPIEHDLFG